MARAATYSDAFNAVAEPRRREILDLLVRQERTVGDIALRLRLRQPSVSKHLRVLHHVGLVRARRQGSCIFYRTHGAAVEPIHAWAAQFEELWRHQLLRVKRRAEAASARGSQIHTDARAGERPDPHPQPQPNNQEEES